MEIRHWRVRDRSEDCPRGVSEGLQVAALGRVTLLAAHATPGSSPPAVWVPGMRGPYLLLVQAASPGVTLPAGSQGPQGLVSGAGQAPLTTRAPDGVQREIQSRGCGERQRHRGSSQVVEGVPAGLGFWRSQGKLVRLGCSILSTARRRQQCTCPCRKQETGGKMMLRGKIFHVRDILCGAVIISFHTDSICYLIILPRGRGVRYTVSWRSFPAPNFCFFTCKASN